MRPMMKYKAAAEAAEQRFERHIKGSFLSRSGLRRHVVARCRPSAFDGRPDVARREWPSLHQAGLHRRHQDRTRGIKMMDLRLTKKRRYSALLCAAIAGEECLSKYLASHPYHHDSDEIAKAKWEAEKMIRAAEADLLHRFPWLADLKSDQSKLQRDIQKLEIADRNRRGAGNIFDPSRKRNQSDLGSAAIDATLRHREI